MKQPEIIFSHFWEVPAFPRSTTLDDNKDDPGMVTRISRFTTPCRRRARLRDRSGVKKSLGEKKNICRAEGGGGCGRLCKIRRLSNHLRLVGGEVEFGWSVFSVVCFPCIRGFLGVFCFVLFCFCFFFFWLRFAEMDSKDTSEVFSFCCCRFTTLFISFKVKLRKKSTKNCC